MPRVSLWLNCFHHLAHWLLFQSATSASRCMDSSILPLVRILCLQNRQICSTLKKFSQKKSKRFGFVVDQKRSTKRKKTFEFFLARLFVSFLILCVFLFRGVVFGIMIQLLPKIQWKRRVGNHWVVSWKTRFGFSLFWFGCERSARTARRQYAKRDLWFFFFLLLIWFGLVVREVRERQESHLQKEIWGLFILGCERSDLSPELLWLWWCWWQLWRDGGK